MASRLGRSGGGDHGSREGADREQTDRKKEYIIFKGDKERKTPPRLAKACKCVYIHITQYRSIVGRYCTFFYIYRGEYIIYIYI